LKLHLNVRFNSDKPPSGASFGQSQTTDFSQERNALAASSATWKDKSADGRAAGAWSAHEGRRRRRALVSCLQQLIAENDSTVIVAQSATSNTIATLLSSAASKSSYLLKQRQSALHFVNSVVDD